MMDYTKYAKIASCIVGFISPFAAKYGVDNEILTNCITGLCIIGFAVAPSVIAIFKK